MRYGSVCSGVDAATLAWEPLGWKCKFFSEIEPFPSAVLAARWPKIPNLGDFTQINGSDYAKKIDMLTGGTPCQSFSVAGLRAGLADERGNLACEFARLAFSTQVRWLLWENVPGVLSSNKGSDFADFLSILAGWRVEVPIVRTKKNGEVIRKWKNSGIITPAPGGFGLAWRVLDAQYVRVDGFPRAIPQRRRRLFVIGYIGDWKRPATVLFDQESLSGNPPPRRGNGPGTTSGFEVGLKVGRVAEVSCTLDTGCGDGASRNQVGMLCMAHGQDNAEERTDHEQPAICLGFVKNDGPLGDCWQELAPTIRSGAIHAVALQSLVRSLMPIECERLMGFPGNHTRIPWKKKAAEDCPDGPRYKACGNSQCVNVMRWIGMRIEAVDKLLK